MTLNRLSVAAFNELYYDLHRLKRKRVRQHYSTYFYPLDSVLNWNRLYGSRGMLQYQCAIPWGDERVVMRALLDEISRSGQASFLAVLKTFGDLPSPGMLSFPRPGATLALDFPNRGDGNARADGPTRRDRARGRRRSLSGQGRAHAGGHVQARLSPLGGFGRTEGSHAEFRFLAKGGAMTETPKRVAILGATSAHR